MAEKLKVAVLGCGGIIGQHMHISVPEGVEPLFVRKHPFPLSVALDLEDWNATRDWLEWEKPDVIVNLAGESRPDVVQREPQRFTRINIDNPLKLSNWCDDNDAHLIQVSSQAVFSGTSAPYVPSAELGPAPSNYYGGQKSVTEGCIALRRNWTIVRPTFVLGIRPFPALGRENPAEAILSGKQTWQVDNRWFSVSFAWDVAAMLWKMAQLRPKGKIVHCGNPERLSRYQLACLLNPNGAFEPVTHEHLAANTPLAIAERPLDTTFKDAYFETPLEDGIQELRAMYHFRDIDALPYRALELAAFLKRPAEEVRDKLREGFGLLHNEVTEDFRAFFGGALSIAERADLLSWYRHTEAYLWELTAYHTDAGFNYAGTCEGVITRLKEDWRVRGSGCGRGERYTQGKPEYNVLCLGDGVGTLTIKARESGLTSYYHDLEGSRTEAFALARFAMRFGDDLPGYIESTSTFQIIGFGGPIVGYDAIVSLDYLEHIPNVEEWVRAIFAALKPGGLFCAQNGFNCGSGPDGPMPMHLAVNDRFEHDWDPLLSSVGFVQEAPQWYRRPL